MSGVGTFIATYYASYADAITYGINVSMNLTGSPSSLQLPHFIAYTIYTARNAINVGTVDDNTVENLINLGDITSISWRAIDANTGVLLPTIFSYGDEIPFSIDGDQTYGIGYYLYPAIPCFLEGSEILCKVDDVDRYIPIETMKVGTLVKTEIDGYKKVELIGKRSFKNSAISDSNGDHLYKCSTEKYPELTKDLYLTGGHAILVDSLTDSQRATIIKLVHRIFITGNKYRLMASIDERAEAWNSEGIYTVWHFALENNIPTENYGVYANGGLLVESSSLNYMKHKSNLMLM
jgi:hypothetical protein